MNQTNRNPAFQYHRSEGEPTATRSAGQETVQAPALTLPTGGGAIRGIDEKFQVNIPYTAEKKVNISGQSGHWLGGHDHTDFHITGAPGFWSPTYAWL